MDTAISNEAAQSALIELEQIGDELSRRRRERGMEFYVPNAMQYRAHQSACRNIIYVGGNRSGKSTFGAMELCYHLTRRYPDWYPKERRYDRPIKAVVVATEYPIVERTIEPKILSYLPKDYIAKLKRTPQGYMQRMVCVDGSTVDMLTNEMDDMAFESADWDFYWGDEPQKKQKYYAIRRGLVDRRGMTVMTFTPLIEPWMKEELVDKADGKRIEVFTVTLYDNQQDIRGNIILPLDSIREFELDLPEDVRKTRVYGEFFHMRGLVYTEYSPAIHERDFTYTYPDPVVCVLDPHERKPHWVIWAYIARNDDVYVDSEMVMHCSLAELRRKILQHEAMRGYYVSRRLIDPNFGGSPDGPGSNRTVKQTLASKPWPLPFGDADDDKEAGRFAVKDALHFDPTRPLSITNKPKLYFSRSRVRGTIRSVRNHQYEDWQGKVKHDRDLKEKEKPKDTDGADCIRYLCRSRPDFNILARGGRRIDALATAPY